MSLNVNIYQERKTRHSLNNLVTPSAGRVKQRYRVQVFLSWQIFIFKNKIAL